MTQSKNPSQTQHKYSPDILGEGYEQLTLDFPNDYEGKVTATLVRKKLPHKSNKAVLYVHGFIDYFFQTEMAEQFNQHGYDFYALDLRKYGRSLLPHQKPYYVLNLGEYDAEISEALKIIGQEDHDSVILSGHSTGGLITTLYAIHHPSHPLLKGLWLNSPFYDFNMNPLKRKFALPKLSQIGAKFPKLKFPSELNKFYVKSLHKQFHGEWDFNLTWKPSTYPLVSIGFVHAVFEAQKEIHQGSILTIPALVMCSDKTRNPKKFNHDAQTSDVILNIKQIQQRSTKLQGDVSVITIKDGLHDLVLSSSEVRTVVYQELFQWLAQKKL